MKTISQRLFDINYIHQSIKQFLQNSFLFPKTLLYMNMNINDHTRTTLQFQIIKSSSSQFPYQIPVALQIFYIITLMKIRYLIAILLITLFAFETYSQRGGGSRSRSSSRSRSFSRGTGGRSFFFGSTSRSYRSRNSTSLWDWLFGSDDNSTNSTNANDNSGRSFYDNTTQNNYWQTPSLTDQTSNSWAGWIFGGVVAILAFLGWNSSGMSGQRRLKQIKKVTDNFEQVNEYRSSLSDSQRSQLIERLMQSSWVVQIKVGSSPMAYRWDLKMKDLTKRTDFVYEIEAIGSNDQNGNSKIKGIIMFRDNSMSICFDKLHVDRERAGQTGKWDILIYEGHMNGGNFEGIWYYQGFKNDGEYSGQMKMVPK